MKLYMIRHGQSQTNLEHRFTGQADAPLTDQGKEDARRAGKLLKNVRFDRVYSSDLSRAVETAQIALDQEPIRLEMIRELSVGSLAWRKVADCEAEYGEELWKNRNAYNYKPYGGETEAELQKRARDFLTMLENDPCDTVAAFSHAGFITCVLTQVLGASFDRKHIACPNGSVSVFAFDGKKWILEQWGMLPPDEDEKTDQAQQE